MSGSLLMADRPRQDSIPVGIQPDQVDLDLVEMVRARDVRSARRLYVRLHPIVDGSIIRVLGARESDHDDLIQLSFEQIVRSIHRRQYHGNCSLIAWASLIASRVAFAELRNRYRRRKFIAENASELVNLAARGSDGVATALAREQLKFVRCALGSLTVDRASVVLLHDVEGYQLEEIALLLNISVSAAQSRLFRGRKQFLSKYDELTREHPQFGGTINRGAGP